MSASKLFAPIKVGNLDLKHRVVLAPLTRYRANPEHVHYPLAAEYYGQRASTPGTLLITEATFISPQAAGYEHVPGIWNDAQVEAWKKVTDAVHAKGSFIYCQLWALGRAAKAETLKKQGGYDVVSASDVPFEGGDKPRPLSKEEIKEYVSAYKHAAENALKAGFDGVELHGANGYLVDQFIQNVSNKRTDEYGGSIENRLRFVKELLGAITSVAGQERTGLRLSPFGHFQDMRMSDSDLYPTFTALVEHLTSTYPNLAYLSVVEPRISGDSDAPKVEDSEGPVDSTDFIYNIWLPRPLLSGGYTTDPEKAEKVVNEHEGVLGVFGRAFLANPDLPLRLKNHIPLNEPNRDTFYAPQNGGATGYVDYPFADESLVKVKI